MNQMIQIELEQVHIWRNSRLQAQPSKLEMPGMLYLKAFTQVPLQSYGEPKLERTESWRLVEDFWKPCNRFKIPSRIRNHHFLPKLKGIINMWELNFLFGGQTSHKPGKNREEAVGFHENEHLLKILSTSTKCNILIL